MAITPPSRPLLAGFICLFLLVLLAYHSAPGCGFVWDDDILLTGNHNLGSVAGLWRCWTDPSANQDYYPITFTSWWVEGRLWGLDPRGYHVDNVLLHALNAVLLWLILRRLEVTGAWVIAAAWAVHPVQVESVAWVSQRKNVLSGLFFFLAAWCFVRACLGEGPGGPSGAGVARPRWLYALSLVLFIAAMFAKPVTMTLAGILPLLVWWKRGRIRRADAALLAPYLVLALPMALLTLWVQRHTVKAVGWEFQQSFMERVLIAGRALWFYAGKLAWPSALCFAYPRWAVDAWGWAAYLFPAAVGVLLAGLWWQRARLGRVPLAAVLVFIVALSPGLGFFRIYWHRYYFVADHVQYLASAALIALAVGTAAHYVSRCRAMVRRAAAVLAAVGLLTLALLSARQVLTYRDADSLWKETLAHNPECWIAYNNMGVQLMDRGERDAAIVLYRKALSLNPRHYEAHNNLGLALSHYGQAPEKLPEAIDHFRQAIAGNPGDGHYHCNLGNALAQWGQPREALAEFDKAMELTPEDATMAASAHYQKGKALAALGQPAEAIEEIREAIRLNAGDWKPHNDLGVLLGEAGHFADAVGEFGDAARLAPENPTVQANLARAQQLLRDRGAGGAPP